MQKAICVYSSSSDAVALDFFTVAAAMGTLIAQHGHTLVYGGARTGLMGELARSAQNHSGKVIFAKGHYRQSYYVAPDPASALAYIESYEPAVLGSKWF